MERTEQQLPDVAISDEIQQGTLPLNFFIRTRPRQYTHGE